MKVKLLSYSQPFDSVDYVEVDDTTPDTSGDCCGDCSCGGNE